MLRKRANNIRDIFIYVVIGLLFIVILYSMLNEGNGGQLSPLSMVEYGLWMKGNIIWRGFLLRFLGFLMIGILIGTRLQNPNKSRRALICFLATFYVLTALAVLYYYNGAIYFDYLLTAFIGISSGYCMGTEFLYRKDSHRRTSQKRRYYQLYYTVSLVSICAMIVMQTSLPYGLLRLNINNSPRIENASFSTLTTDSGVRAVYKLDVPNSKEDKLEQLVGIFDLNWDWQRRDRSSKTYLDGAVSVGNTNEKTQLTVWHDLSWHYMSKPPYYAKTTQIMENDAVSIANMSIMPLLKDDENATLVSIEDDYLKNGEGQNMVAFKRIEFQIESSRNDVQYDGDKITVDVADGQAFSILSTVRRYVAKDSVLTISPRKAYRESKVLSTQYTMANHIGAWIIKSIDDTYISYEDWLLPAYSIQFECYEDGKLIKSTETTIDAVDRGILPYIIPGGILLILLAAAGVAIQRKNALGKG